MNSIFTAQNSTDESEDQFSFQDIFAYAPIGICLTAPPEGRILKANRRMCEMLGYSEKELTGKSYPEITHPDDRAVSQESVQQLLLGNIDRFFLEKRYLHKNGESVWARVNVQLRRDANHAPKYFIAHLEDIRHLKESEEAISQLQNRAAVEKAVLEEQLRQAQKMEVIGQLAGGVAHDFNNLLSPILGYADLALTQLRPGDPMAEDLQAIRDAAVRAAALTRQLLAFSSKQLLSMTPLNLNRVVREFAKMARHFIRESIEITLHLDSDLGDIKADETQLHQILMNLSINARDAMPQGGSLVIETSNAAFDETFAKQHAGLQPGPYALVSVRDTGSGMAPEILERVFEPFFTTKPPGHGTGLGLPMTYGIVKQHQGYIWITSAPEKGTVVKIAFPKTGEPAAEESAAGHLPLADLSGQETLLVVEDDARVRNLVMKMLTRHGYRAVPAVDAQDALRYLESDPGSPDLVITDLIMPGLNGRELQERISALRPGIPVLFISGYPRDVLTDAEPWSADFHLLAKPFTTHELLSQVRTLLWKEPAGSQVMLPLKSE